MIATEKAEQNEKAVDPWTLVHLAAGLALGLMNVPRKAALAISVVYEAAEQVFERQRWGKELFETHGPESLPNALMDSAALLAGHLLGQAWNRTGRRGEGA